MKLTVLTKQRLMTNYNYNGQSNSTYAITDQGSFMFNFMLKLSILIPFSFLNTINKENKSTMISKKFAKIIKI